jgi:PadR family transcriptional regulator, regulatory protein PadR
MTNRVNGERFESLRQELRRGCLVVGVLAALRTEQYGYTLRKQLSGMGLEMDEGTLYPLLRRLESQRLLTSEWREHEKRNKRFYRLSELGAEALLQLSQDWRALNSAIDEISMEGSNAASGAVLTKR